MKFLVFADVHNDKKYLNALLKRAREDDVEFIICAGDLSNFGAGLLDALERFSKIGKKFYMIPGNHEEPDTKFRDVMSHFDHCIDFHTNVFKKNGYVFCGFGGGGFALEDAEFRKVSREWYGKYKGEKIVLITHGPAFGTKLDKLDKNHVGNRDYRSFIERIKPKLAISGHMHETAGEMDVIGKTKVINPGWEGMVVELS
ncbi:hypothetical protein HOL21_03720 [Candidatus Woesearchaeota archaeon]|jgi:uncharacterized protein|nr:hypothetical protein [Candidatus Woesearchaeota archaeon]MBT5397293.1 hypothetical protein [Candidatus Woesearchaeota archaeon]MBT5924282.1 hypothetical protein [Candidatus Woesearchaeota archaeon]MBT6367862.1 hypothetical protein [Candidatus Woesearchaeota archaeon]MBT7762693.1 hypothetical protein [Candidatus Woesearchaeota archaeon]